MNKRFAWCLDNRGDATSLIARKFYEMIPDEPGSRDDLIWVIDESGADYL